MASVISVVDVETEHYLILDKVDFRRPRICDTECHVSSGPAVRMLLLSKDLCVPRAIGLEPLKRTSASQETHAEDRKARGRTPGFLFLAQRPIVR